MKLSMSAVEGELEHMNKSEDGGNTPPAAIRYQPGSFCLLNCTYVEFTDKAK